MPRALTPRSLRAMQAQTTNDALLPLVTIFYAPTGETFRAVANTQDVMSRGNLYARWAIDITLAQDALDTTPEVQVKIDNIGQELTDLLRAASVPPDFLIEIVNANTPDIVEMRVPGLKLRNAQWDAKTITGTLQVDDVFSVAFPSKAASYDPAQFPGLFT